MPLEDGLGGGILKTEKDALLCNAEKEKGKSLMNAVDLAKIVQSRNDRKLW